MCVLKFYINFYLKNVCGCQMFVQNYCLIARSFYIYTLLVCLSVCLYSINLKTAEPIGPKFCTGPNMTQGKVYGWSKSNKLGANKILLSLSFENPRNFFLNSLYVFCFVLQCIHRENVHNCKRRWAHSEL